MLPLRCLLFCIMSSFAFSLEASETIVRYDDYCLQKNSGLCLGPIREIKYDDDLVTFSMATKATMTTFPPSNYIAMMRGTTGNSDWTKEVNYYLTRFKTLNDKQFMYSFPKQELLTFSFRTKSFIDSFMTDHIQQLETIQEMIPKKLCFDIATKKLEEYDKKISAIEDLISSTEAMILEIQRKQ